MPTAIFKTNFGNFSVYLDEEKAPITAGNFIKLAKDGFTMDLHSIELPKIL